MNQNVFFFLKNKNNTRYLYDTLSIAEGLEQMRKHGFTATPVINSEGIYIGTIKEGDFLYYLLDHPSLSKEDFKSIELSQLIHKEYNPAVSMDVTMDALFEQSLKQNFVPVVDDRHVFIGIVTRQSILTYLMKEAEKYAKVFEKFPLEEFLQEEKKSE